MSDNIISVYAKTGVTISANRQIRLTGERTDGAWEVDLPTAADQRTHAIALPAPKGINDTVPDVITAVKRGQARTYGAIVDIEVSSPVDFDDELSAGTDGRAHKARGADKNASCVALAKKGAGAVCPVMLGLRRK